MSPCNMLNKEYKKKKKWRVKIMVVTRKLFIIFISYFYNMKEYAFLWKNLEALN